jgi:hypothetical protein
MAKRSAEDIMRTKTVGCEVNWRGAGESLAIKAQTLLYALDGVIQLKLGPPSVTLTMARPFRVVVVRSVRPEEWAQAAVPYVGITWDPSQEQRDGVAWPWERLA